MNTSLLEKLVLNPRNFSLCVSVHSCPKMSLDFSVSTVCSGAVVHLHLSVNVPALLLLLATCFISLCLEKMLYVISVLNLLKTCLGDFPDGPLVKTSPSNSGDAGLTPGRGVTIPHASQPKKKKVKKKKAIL